VGSPDNVHPRDDIWRHVSIKAIVVAGGAILADDLKPADSLEIHSFRFAVEPALGQDLVHAERPRAVDLTVD
jgi:hypothetical protein